MQSPCLFPSPCGLPLTCIKLWKMLILVHFLIFMSISMFAEQTLSEQESSTGIFYLIRATAFAYQIIAIVLLSLIALAVNHFYFQYPGNYYFPPDCLLMGFDLFLIYAGFFFLQGRDGKITQIVKEVIYFVLVMMLICLVTNAAQYTPFPTIDQHILTFESLLNIDTNALITWTNANPLLKTVLELAYSTLNYQLCLMPLIVIVAGRTDLIREYYFLLITTALIGFTVYYFFPTTAPASVMNSEYFSEAQRATYLKFFQIHHYIQPSTMDGGMIAMPSFHVIWAWLCLYLVRGWPVVFLVLLPINLLLIASCVLLGWHYCIDIFGGVVVVLLAHFVTPHVLRTPGEDGKRDLLPIGSCPNGSNLDQPVKQVYFFLEH